MQVLRSRATLALAMIGAALCAATPAVAAPATVSVRVEGASATLVPRTTVQTTNAPVVKDGNQQHSCTGTSAAGALEVATAGQWNGPWYNGLGYSVYTIKGETYDFSTPDSWAFWVNHKSASMGVCGIELTNGDEILFFVDRCEYDPATNRCTNTQPLPLSLLDVPARVERGQQFTVRVIRYNQKGQSAPVNGAAVSGGGAAATSGPDGKATLSLQSAGDVVLQATAPGYVRSASEPVCSYDPAVGGCSVVAPAPSGGGTPPAQDTRLPLASVTGISPGQRFSLRRAPRLLRGVVDPGGAGVHLVRFRLRRAAGGRCTFYSAVVERFRPGRCTATGFFYRVGDRPTWEYLLPARLEAGTYDLDVRVMDRWGREVTTRVRFVVLWSVL